MLLLDYASRQGLDRRDLMRISGLSASDLADPDTRVKVTSMLKLWRAAIEILDDPLLGLHVARSIRVTNLGLVGYTMMYSRNLLDALSRLSRFERIISEAVRFRLIKAGSTYVAVWQAHPSLAALRHPTECGVAAVISIAREITGTDLVPARVELSSARPDSPGKYRSELRCAVKFDSPVNSITFSKQQMSLPARSQDETLVGYLDDLAVLTLDPIESRDQNMTESVRRTLWSMMPGGRPDLWRTAAEIGVSARTLQRRLGEEGSSFSKVLDELRRDLSEELLSDRRLSVAEVAFLLGYSEPSAFQRAFRRWRGISPRRYRSS